jgi:hypothetical protein
MLLPGPEAGKAVFVAAVQQFELVAGLKTARFCHLRWLQAALSRTPI